MSSQSTKYGHPLDTVLADRNMFSWFGPSFQLLAKHWLVAIVAGVVTCLLDKLLSLFPWPYVMILASWWVRALHTFLGYTLLTLVAVIAYRAIAHREGTRHGVGDVNPLARAASCAVQVSIVWLIGALIVQFALILLARLIFAMFAGSASPRPGVLISILVLSTYGIPLVVFLLSPLWIMLGVAGALSHAHAARSPESGLGAVINSLRLVFGQKWRVLWPAYIFGAVIAALIFLQIKLSFLPRSVEGPWFARFLTVVSVAIAVVMTFVIERAYAPDLGLRTIDDDGRAPVPVPLASPTPGMPSPHIQPAPAVATAAGPAVGELMDNESRTKLASELTSLVERGLAADARFFANQPDNTVALAKRLVQAQRADLALRVLQPYIEDHQSHRLHLTGALLAAELLARDPNQLPATARLLAQLQVLYPNEPMVDRLVRLTDKAMAQSQFAAPKSPDT